MKGVGTARTSSKTQIYVWNFNSVKYFRGFILKGSMFKQRLHGLNIYWYEACLNACLWVDLRHRTAPLTVGMVHFDRMKSLCCQDKKKDITFFYNNKVILIDNKRDTWKTTRIIYKMGPIAVYSFMNPQIEKYVFEPITRICFPYLFCLWWLITIR